jgi:signal transduction histidine kinase/streptogramin lyase
VVDSPDGVLWFGSTGHACKVCPPEEGKVWEYPEPVGDLFGVAFDPRGTIWLGTQSGLWEAREQHLVRPEGIEGASFGVINCLLTDRDGNLWIGTEDKGLYCLYRKPFYTYTTQDGLASDDVWSITQARDESLWVATKAGASRLAGGQFATVRVSGHEDDGIWNDVRVITEDPAGTIWAGTGKGTLFVSRSELVTPEDGRLRFLFSSAYGNGHGAFWLVGDNGGMFSFEHGIWKGRIIDSPGTEVLHLLGIIQDSYGDLWVGSSEHGLFHLQKDRTTRVTQSDGLTSNMVGPVLADSDGTLWLASNKGLNRLKNGRITRYTTAEGLAEDIVLNVLEDGSGWFWLNGHRGIHRVRRQQLEDLAQGKLRLLDCVTYGLEDGLLSVEGNGGFFPNSCKTRDGRVWFPTTKGLAVVDPKLAALDALPPPVLVESLCADGQVVYDNGPGPLAATSAANLARDQNENQGPSTSRRAPDRRELRLLAGRADTLLFHLTANTLLRTEEVRFRYRLGGRDPQWTELGTQPSVLIPNLAPGHYRLQATACNSHGVWNHTGAEFGFYVAPFFHQTWTFYGLCAGTLLLGLGTFEAYRHRVQRRILALEKQAALGRERERIARDLHDDLGASLSRIARLSEVAAKELQNHPEAAPQLGRISSIASQVVDSISELVWATNPKYDNLESLAAYCREYAAQFFDSTGIDCRLNFPSDLPAQALTADFRRQLFLVFKEILHNVAKHAQAKTVVITLFMNHSELDLVIQDDGRGLPSDPIPKYHHGLTNMRERIAALRGAFEIHSEPGQGTRVSVRVPLPNGKSQDDNTR